MNILLPIYLENPKEELSAMPWPKSLVLSSARAAALTLFELKTLIESDDKRAEPHKLSVHKIDKDQSNKPENMAVGFAGSILYAFPMENSDMEARKNRIQTAESNFVKSLGLRYTR